VVEVYHDDSIMCGGICGRPLTYLDHGIPERVLQAGACFSRMLEAFSQEEREEHPYNNVTIMHASIQEIPWVAIIES
jgi:hypothetical protein